jgi:hypothetical protein
MLTCEEQLAALTTALVGITEAAADLLDAHFYYDDDPPEANRLKSAMTLSWIAIPKRFAASPQPDSTE